MKRNNIYKIVLLILAILISPTAFAVDSGPAGTFVGQITISNYQGVTHDVMWDCRHPNGCHRKYGLHKYTLNYGGNSYPAYCIYPNAKARSVNNVVCTPIDREVMPNVYYLVDQHYNELMENPVVADLAFRMVGSIEKFGTGTVALEELRQKQREGEAMFTTTYQARALGMPFANPDFYGFVLHNNNSYHYDASNETNWEEGTVQQAAKLAKEAADAVGAGYNGAGANITDSGSLLSGKKFELTPMEETRGEDGSITYRITSIGEVPYAGIKVSATKGTVVSFTWNETTGTVRVAPVGDDCRAVISICPILKGPQDSSSSSSESKVTKSKTPCKCNVPVSRTKKYPCKRSHWVESYDGKGGNYVCDEYDYSNPTYKTNYKCLYTLNECEEFYKFYRGVETLPVIESSATEEHEVTLDTGYETEHDLTFDDSIAYNKYVDEDEELTTLDTKTSTSNGSSSSSVFYCTISGNADEQSYIAIASNAIMCETFELNLPCDNCYEGNCAPTGTPDDFLDVDIHNCCEEGARTKGRQYALNELFCDYSKQGLGIPNFALRCNGDKYKDDRPINDYCEQYCSASFYYELPGPTHSKQDRYFYWTKRNGATGPILNQYRRCRTLIHYDEWYDAYKDNVDSLVSNYNGSQLNYAYYNMWNDLIENVKGTETIEAYTIECKTTWEWTKSVACEDPQKTGCTTTEHSTGSPASRTVDAYTIKTYDTSIGKYHSLTGSYAYGVLERYDQVDGSNSYSKIKLASKKTPTDMTKYYNKEQAEEYIKKWNDKHADAVKAAEGNKPSDAEGDNKSTSCNKETITIDSQIDPNATRTKYKSQADAFIASYDGVTTAIKQLKDDLNTCGGELSTDEATTVNDEFGGEKSIKERVKFGKEPEMEFSYAAKYIGMDGTENDQEIPVRFDKVNEAGEKTGQCIQEVASGAKAGLEGDAVLFDAEYEEGTKFFGNYRDKVTYKGDKNSELYDMKAIGTGNGKLDSVANQSTGIEWYGGHKNDVYHADKKFTTDARAHMTCRWVDVPEEEVYTIIPNGIVMEEEATGRLCEDTAYNCINYMDGHGNEYTNDGIYHTYKGHVQGKFETYFTLYNIAVLEGEEKGIFDDIIHNQGLPCSGQQDLKNYNGKDVNATCYIEIKNEFAEYFDCTGAQVLSKNDQAKEICAGNTTPKLLYDYKVVDTEEMFDESYVQTVGGGFAHNWVTDPTGKAKLEQMTNDGKNDVTYAPEKLTYSFTLTPTDLRQIREYNKTRTEFGGYSDFNLYCSQSADLKTLEKCKSRFVEAISGGSPLTSGSVTLELKTNNIDLATSRSRIWGGV